MDGLLLVDKPSGFTSHDVVAKIRGILVAETRNMKHETRDASIPVSQFTIHNSSGSKIRVGHTGTLDPAATGLMILVLGKYTKRAGEFSKLDKTYEAELTLGQTSSTGDKEGKITGYSEQVTGDSKKPSLEEIKTVLDTFLGEISQTPPAYSAIKVNGQRAYKLARQGKEVKLKPRQVTVNRLQVIDYKYPKLSLITEVSSGTYIRSLAEDIGEKLGTGAYLSDLRRTKVGKHTVVKAIKINDLSNNLLANIKLLKTT